MNNPKLLEVWIEKLNKIDWRPTETSVLCSKHFEESCFRISDGKYVTLKINSVPTILTVRMCAEMDFKMKISP